MAREISELFNSIVKNVNKMAEILGGLGRGEKQMYSFSLPENRHEISKLIIKCKEADMLALEKMQEFLNTI